MDIDGFESFREAGFFMKRKIGTEITGYAVRGERSSGTNFLDATLATVPSLSAQNIGWKHGFFSPKMIADETLIISIVRHWRPWILSMHRKPWHASKRMHSLPFSDFIREPWESYKLPDRRVYSRFTAPNAEEGPIIYNDRHPIDGKHIPNIIEMRNLKNINLLSFTQLDCNFLLVRYEWINEEPSRLSKLLREGFDISDAPDFSPIEKHFAGEYPRFKRCRPKMIDKIPEADLDFIRSALSANMEYALGYEVFPKS